ncbi:DUF4276 family protein [Aetokthonos hydrillicola Thurmond2011]|jgi:hypothetical protein|uniref:DUF4276 family protein n=1 Tax=Aetokthonos hydrillicola Thurmond2011 TaxID=2712845 RepID=A0AAP5I274_9CYAN|nr:DUF4276 family protein [Aetokthonos hydrillicola]MBO3457474.1 DUF4276 family protein [Aetokthonos hydrillicola CCALA 1050]MBW4586004.1 DUF4276 family protein [Aetokthonos hydrillicola CCALA 1050]MDR9893767.1 DUF4276 family protein [Aetokthonos hydrillicola Thurmond2011]
MVKEIRIYIEGGGDGKESKAKLREGFHKFLQVSRERRINITMCGKRNDAFRDFKNALKSHQDAFNLLLVDAEAPVKLSPWEHLKSRDNWDLPDVDDIHCHLMVQVMEAWFIADIETLRKFYGQGFKENAIKRSQDVESLDKDILNKKLKAATCNTSKGEYHKIKHASLLLASLNADQVRKASLHCDRLFRTLVQIIDTSMK